MSLRFSSVALLLFAGCTTQSMATVVEAGATGNDGSVTLSRLTYWDDVFPVAQAHCTTCHQEGGSGPFSMLDEAAVKAEFAKGASAGQPGIFYTMVHSGEMPPWKPASGCRDLKGARTMSQADTQKILDWASQSSPVMGTAPSPLPKATSVLGLERVDSTLSMAQAYTPTTTSDEPDHYQCFILDPKLASDTYLIGYNVLPGSVGEVHHVLLYPADPADAQQLDDASPNEIGWTCFGGPGTQNPTTVGGWVPGAAAVQYPTDTGISVKAGQVLVMQIHYNTSYVSPSPDLTKLELELATTPVAKPAVILPLLNTSFSVPPGAMSYDVKASQKAPAAATIWGVLPHAHTHAQHMKVDGDDGCMIDIPQWEFQWQQMYFFEDPLSVKKGDQLNLTCTYDNTGSAPLTWGEKTSDEMCLNYLYVTL